MESEIAKERNGAAQLDLETEEKRASAQRADVIARQMATAEAAAKVNASILPKIEARLEQLAETVIAEKLVTAFGTVANFRGMDMVELAAQTLSSLPGIGPVLARFRANRPTSRDRGLDRDDRR